MSELDAATVKPKRVLFDIHGKIILIALACLVILFSVKENSFLSFRNLQVILESMCILTLLSLGVMFLLVGGEIDISFVSVLELSSVLVCIASPGNTLLIIVVGVIGGTAIGLINGIFCVKVGIPSFLVTLATFIAVAGLVSILTEYKSVLLLNNQIVNIFYTKWGILNASVFWMIGIAIISGIILRRLQFGRWVYATGGNERAARLMGIPTQRIKLSLFVICGFLASIAGIIAACRSLSARPGVGGSYLMPAIAAPILGGALLTGGRGTVLGTFLGCALLTVIINGVNIMGFQPAYRDLFMGAILIGALSLGRVRKSK